MSISTRISFEVWPPRTPEGDLRLNATLTAARSLNPPWISVTVSDRRPKTLTHQTAVRIQREWGIPAMPHLRCLGCTTDDFRREIEEVVEHGIHHVLVVRGDRSDTVTMPTSDALRYAAEGVALIRQMGAPLIVAVGCHPEVHEEALDAESDLYRLKEKVDAGADLLISQAFFDVSAWFSFAARVRASGIHIPLIPGVLPMYGPAQANALMRMSRARIPVKLAASFKDETDEATVREAGRAHTMSVCKELVVDPYASGLHFFTFNRSDGIEWIKE